MIDTAIVVRIACEGKGCTAVFEKEHEFENRLRAERKTRDEAKREGWGRFRRPGESYITDPARDLCPACSARVTAGDYLF